jgi:hypothetical protein
MSELINTQHGHESLRRYLLASVSAVTLLISAYEPQAAQADEETDHPIIWVELGGQLERVDGGQQPFMPPFTASLANDPFTSPAVVQRPPGYAIGGESKISFNPERSDWVFSVSMRYGRSNSTKGSHQETSPASAIELLSVPVLNLYSKGPVPPKARRFSDATTNIHENHAVVDFQAGKDVGMGLFGGNGKSLFSFGVRYAQFALKSTNTIGADPDFAFSYKYATQAFGFHGKFNFANQSWHLYTSSEESARSFRGIGPSLAWDASTPLAGNSQNAEFTFDWGANAAILFGRQKMRAHHDTTDRFRPTQTQGTINRPLLSNIYHHTYNPARSRTVTVPNIGGFASVSLKFPNAKISLGYRGDFFFGAMDGGIDAPKNENRGFYGPFATISVGIGG